MPGSPDPSYHQVSDAAVAPNEPGMTAQWSRVWNVGGYGGARVDAYQFTSPAAARAAAASYLAGPASDAVLVSSCRGRLSRPVFAFSDSPGFGFNPLTEGRSSTGSSCGLRTR